MDYKSGEETFSGTIPICNIKSQNWVLRNIVEVFFKALNVELKCPLKKNLKIKIKSLNLRKFSPIARMMDPEAVRKSTILFTTGSQSVPIMSVNLYMMRIERDFV